MSTPTTQRTNSKMPQALDAGHQDGWRSTTLGEVADIEMGQSPPGNTYNDRGDGLPFLQGSAEFSDRYPMPNRWCSAPKKIAEPGDLLISVRAPVGDTNIAHTQVAFGRGLARVRSTDEASADYLRLVIQSEVNPLNQSASGTTFASITAKNLRGFPVLVPPLAEQRRIVEQVEEHFSCLDTAEARVAAAQTRLEQLERSVLQDALAGPGSQNEKLPEGGSDRCLSDDAVWGNGSRGDDWRSTTLDEVADIEMGQSPPGSTYNDHGDGLPFLQGSAEFGDRYPMPDRWCSEPKKIAEPGDLLISVRAPVGDTNFADIRVAIGRGLARVRSTDEASVDYLRLVIQSEVNRLNQSASGTTFASITAKNLRSFPVLVPPLAEQRRIVEQVEEYLERVYRLGEAVDSVLAQGASLRRSILSEAVSGRLTSRERAA